MKSFIYFASIIVLALSATDQHLAFLEEMNTLGLINLPQNFHFVQMKTVGALALFNGNFSFTLNKDGANCEIIFHQVVHQHGWFLAPHTYVPETSVLNDQCMIKTQTASVEGHIILRVIV